MPDKLLGGLKLFSKELLVFTTEVLDLFADLVAENTEFRGIIAVADEEVKRGECVLELDVKSLPLTHFNRGTRESKSCEKCEKYGCHAYVVRLMDVCFQVVFV